MTQSPDEDVSNVGHVIVSFTVSAAKRIDGLSQYSREPRSSGDEFFYDLGTEKFVEADAKIRADKLDAAINAFVDLLGPISRVTLHDPRSFVRLYMTFGPGAETIWPTTLKRLADVNATVWIDT